MSSTLSIGPDLSTTASRPKPRIRAGMLGIVPAEVVKYAIVGVSGIGVNLAVMAVVLHQTTWRDWRASLLASVVSTMSNYVWNNFWTFGSRAHSGLTFVRRYVIYLAVSLVGMAVTTMVYAFTSRALLNARPEIAAMLPVSTLLLCQLVAVVSGTLCNYLLNRTLTWPHPQPR